MIFLLGGVAARFHHLAIVPIKRAFFSICALRPAGKEQERESEPRWGSINRECVLPMHNGEKREEGSCRDRPLAFFSNSEERVCRSTLWQMLISYFRGPAREPTESSIL
jgi:hypothetical protein